MKNEDTGSMRADQPRSGLLLLGGIALALGALGGIAVHTARTAAVPPRAAQPPTPAGYVAHSAHYTLTAEIHAGS